MKNKKVLIAVTAIIVVGLLAMIRFFVTSRADNTIESSITISDDNYNDPGSWTITEETWWQDSSNAIMNVNLKTVPKAVNNSHDYIIAVDLSGSMDTKKLNSLKASLTNIVGGILSTTGNKVALIGFKETGSSYVDLTTNKTTINNAINAFTAGGKDNFEYCYQTMSTIMSGYTRTPGKAITAIVIADGVPSKGAHGAYYAALKDQYAYLDIVGVQYEMGSQIKTEIANITDSQFAATKKTLNNVLLNITINSEVYEHFSINIVLTGDFTVESEKDIEVPFGTASLSTNSTTETQQIMWVLDTQKTGISGDLRVKIKIDESKATTSGTYNVASGQTVSYQISGTQAVTKTSALTPSVTVSASNTNHTVTYNLSGAPQGCSPEAIAQTTHKEGSTVHLPKKISCSGYLFKGWQIPSGVTKVNDSSFIMGNSDVTVYAKWGKPTVTKSLEEAAPPFYNLTRQSDPIQVGDEVMLVDDSFDSIADQVSEGGGEHFYVVSTNSNETVLFAKYNLYVGYIIAATDVNTSSTHSIADVISPDDPKYCLQNELAKGWDASLVGNTDARMVGTVAFASPANSTTPAYWDSDCTSSQYTAFSCNVYDAHRNNVVPVGYATLAQGQPVSSITNPLYESANGYTIAYFVEQYKKNLIKIGAPKSIDIRLLRRTEFDTISGLSPKPAWIDSTTYWLETAQSNYAIYRVRSTGTGQARADAANTLGARPVIVVKTSDIQS